MNRRKIKKIGKRGALKPVKAELARRKRVDSQRRRLLRKEYMHYIPRKHWKRRMDSWISDYMRWNPSSDLDRFFIKMLREYHALTWAEIENVVLEGYVTEYPNSVSDRIFGTESIFTSKDVAPSFRPYNAR